MPDTLPDDTIVAVSTPPGLGAIAVVRLSGPDAVTIASRVYRGSQNLQSLASHSVRYGRVFDSSGKLLDEVLVILMRGPDTYTGEDVVEVSCHGGLLASRLVLDALVEAGARPAEPGEFTKRAFLNDKLDLAQAEAVADVVAARTRKALEAALGQLEGGVSGELRNVRTVLVDSLADLEARLDFPDDVPEELSTSRMEDRLRQTARRLELMVSERTASVRLSAGARVPIVGRPNVGKSSLLNALLGSPRAIVHHLPGTTRDTVEGEIDLCGVPVNLIDTAGLRNAGEDVEEEGVKRSMQEIRRADLVIHVVDASAQDYEPDLDILSSLENKTTLVVVNKTDITSPERALAVLSGLGPGSALASRRQAEDRGVSEESRSSNAQAGTASARTAPAWPTCATPGTSPVFAEVSARNGTGLEQVEKVLSEMILSTRPEADDARCAGLRHLECLRAAIGAIERAISGLTTGTAEELIAFELRDAAQQLGRITGETVGPEVLDSIFSRFCVGK